MDNHNLSGYGPPAPKKWVQARFHHLRWIVISLASVNIALTYIQRLGITVAMVQMVNQTAIYLQEYPDANIEDIENDDQQGEFVWNNFLQSIIINIYLLGYAIPQIFISRLADIYGIGKPTITSQLLVIICLALMPTVAYLSVTYLIVLRFILGVAGSPSYPTAIGLIDFWMPMKEHTKAITLIQFISACGMIINPIFSSYLCSFHWTYVFYVTSILSILWLIIWIIVVQDSPNQSWLISEQELKLILLERSYTSSSASINSDVISTPTVETSRLGPPWIKIFSCSRFYLLLTAWVCYDGTLNAFMNGLPTYFRTVLNLDITTNGLVALSVQSSIVIAVLWGGNLGNYLINANICTSANARLITFIIATAGSSLGWVVPSFMKTNYYTFIWFIMNKMFHPAIEFALIGTVLSDWASLGLSGTVFSIYNTFGNGLTVFFTWSSGYLLDLLGSIESTWNLLFVSYAVANIVGTITFYFVCSMTQPSSVNEGKKCSSSNYSQDAGLNV